MQKYALVIAEDQEAALKKCSGHFSSWKKADWLYDGLTYKTDVTIEDLKNAVVSSDEFLPSVVIDNGKYLSAEKFSPKTWKDTVQKFIEFSGRVSDVSFYVLDVKN